MESERDRQIAEIEELIAIQFSLITRMRRAGISTELAEAVLQLMRDKLSTVLKQLGK